MNCDELQITEFLMKFILEFLNKNFPKNSVCSIKIKNINYNLIYSMWKAFKHRVLIRNLYYLKKKLNPNFQYIFN